MNYIWAAAFFFITLFISKLGYRAYEWIPLILSGFLGYALSRLSTLGNEVKDLRKALAKDWEERNKLNTSIENVEVTRAVTTKDKGATSSQQTISSTGKTPVSKAEGIIQPSISSSTPEEPLVSPQPVQQTSSDIKSHFKSESETERSSNSIFDDKPTDTTPEEPVFISKIKEIVTNYFTGGNLFVRVGIILLFFGVSFLLRYVSEQGLFPIEYRLMSVAAAAIGLLVFGWRLRTTKTTYALLLQGGAVGILYLTIFAAFSIYHLIPPLLAFSVLFFISIFTAALAVLQNSQSLALFGFSGGFLAPILASSGSNNHLGLFSYYIILNLALLAIAWFKAWRPLNLLGFLFTFIVSTAWGVSSYNADKFTTTEPFLIAFFLMYVAIAVLFALRQPPKLKGYVDGSLLFGVPLAASGLQYSLVHNTEYGVALSSFAFGLFYIVLAWGLWKKAGDSLRLLSEAFLALGVIFTSLAIPFALDPSHTAAAWGLEGLGLIWLGSRQQRLSVRSFGLLLLAGASVFVFARHGQFQDIPFANSAFISTMMMTVASLFSARILHKPFEGRKEWEQTLSPLLLSAGLLWLFGGFAQQFLQHYLEPYGAHWMATWLLLLATAVSVAFTVTAKRTQPEWTDAWYVAIGLLVAMVLAAVFSTPLNVHLLAISSHPLQAGGWFAWPIAFVALYWVYKQLDSHDRLPELKIVLHTASALLLISLITWEGTWQLDKRLPNDWNTVWLIIPALLALWVSIKNTRWPFKPHESAYLYYLGSILVFFLAGWCVFALVNKGSSATVLWMPILNPLDIALGIVLISIFHWWRALEAFQVESQGDGLFSTDFKPFARYILGGIAFFGFAWVNFTLFRMMHHYFGITYEANALFNSPMVQTSISILWAILGVIVTVLASRKQLRTLWIIGGGLLVLVVAKLFVIDLSEVGNLARIISFLVVGVLLTSIGYFAPIPDKSEEELALKEDLKGV